MRDTSTYILFAGLLLMTTLLLIAVRAFWTRRLQDENSKFGPCFGWQYCLQKKRRAEISLARLQRDLNSLRCKNQLLQQCSTDYFHTLKESGLDELSGIVQEISRVENTMQVLMQEKDFYGVAFLFSYIYGYLEGEELQTARKKFWTWNDLENWRPKTNHLLIELSLRLQQAAMETKRLGVSRPDRQRNSTMDIATWVRPDLLD